MHAVEEFVLAVSDDGLGKRTSAYEYRITGRGGIGIVNMDLDRDGREARVVGAFPVEKEDELILVTNGGQIIRVPVDGIGVVGRKTRGVYLFRLDDDERVVSVSRLRDANGAAESHPEADPEAGSA